MRAPLSRAELARLGSAYWLIVGVAAIFTLARFSEAFLLLRAQSVGLPLAIVPAVMIVMNIVYTLSAWPAGALSDRLGRYGLLSAGFAFLILADLVLALGGSVSTVMIGVALWGLHMGLTQGLLAALVADTAPEELRGTAFGVFNLVSGIATAGGQRRRRRAVGRDRSHRHVPRRCSVHRRSRWRRCRWCDGELRREFFLSLSPCGRGKNDTYITTVSRFAARVTPV